MTPATITLPRSHAAVTDFYSGEGAVMLGNVPQISFQGSSPFTFEAWVYLDALVDQMTLFARQGEFVLATQGQCLYAARTNQITALTTAALLEEHTWYHVALTFDGLTMAAYLNGLRRETITLQDAGVANQGKPLTIGGSFYGWIEGARLWNMAVGPSQLYRYQWLDYAPGTAGLVGQIDLSQWPPVDTSGAGHTSISLSHGGVRTQLFTPSVELPSGGFCDPYADESVNPGGEAADFTVMAWIAPRHLESSGPHAIFTNGELGGAGMSLMLDQAGKVVFGVGTSTAVTSTGTVPSEEWANVACSWSAASGAAAIYVNGALDASGTMRTAPPLATGAPLVGAAASASSALPINNFIGFIQAVSVWKTVLTPAQVQQYLTDDPLGDENCVADWDLMPPRAQNSVSLNPLGLVGGASAGEISALDSVFAGFDHAVVLGGGGHGDAAPPISGMAPVNIAPSDFSPDARAAMVSEFAAFMSAELGLSDQQQQPFIERMDVNLRRLADDLAAGTARVDHHISTEVGSDGVSRLRLHIDGQSAIIYEGDLDECTVWAIKFIIAVGLALYSVFGFTVNLSRVSAKLTNYLGQRVNTIGLLPQLKAVFSGGVSPTSVYKGLLLLWEYGLLTGIMKLLWQAVTVSVSIWTVISLGGRLILLFSPYAPLEIALFITELALALVGVYQVWNEPANCWKSQVAAGAGPVAA